MNALDAVLKLIFTIDVDYLIENKDYFAKFLPVNTDVKEECCLKYCIRLSGRHCNNCPEHPLNDLENSEYILAEATYLLEENDFESFIVLLSDSDLPFPTSDEINEKLLHMD